MVGRTVSLDRQRIERTDFPVRFRGYDRAAVDAHLRAVADELEARAGSLADAASEQVRAVLAAAEASAAEIVRDAEREAARTRSAAGRAGEEATGRAVAAAGDALTRIEALRGDLQALIGALRPGESEPAAQPKPDEDAEAGARLVALDLALSGTPRADADRYLAEHFRVPDRAALLDEVYAAAGA